MPRLKTGWVKKQDIKPSVAPGDYKETTDKHEVTVTGGPCAAGRSGATSRADAGSDADTKPKARSRNRYYKETEAEKAERKRLKARKKFTPGFINKEGDIQMRHRRRQYENKLDRQSAGNEDIADKLLIKLTQETEAPLKTEMDPKELCEILGLKFVTKDDMVLRLFRSPLSVPVGSCFHIVDSYLDDPVELIQILNKTTLMFVFKTLSTGMVTTYIPTALREARKIEYLPKKPAPVSSGRKRRIQEARKGLA
ncbi:MAG: hypothetical protein Q4D58_04010 [Synergistaceae bacterium]|nr:hypothetical protein [Synergistaceae bacterium]